MADHKSANHLKASKDSNEIFCADNTNKYLFMYLRFCLNRCRFKVVIALCLSVIFSGHSAFPFIYCQVSSIHNMMNGAVPMAQWQKTRNLVGKMTNYLRSMA